MSDPERNLEKEAFRLFDGAIDAKDFKAAQGALDYIERIRGGSKPVKGSEPTAPAAPERDTALENARSKVNGKK